MLSTEAAGCSKQKLAAAPAPIEQGAHRAHTNYTVPLLLFSPHLRGLPGAGKLLNVLERVLCHPYRLVHPQQRLRHSGVQILLLGEAGGTALISASSIRYGVLTNVAANVLCPLQCFGQPGSAAVR